MRPRSGRQSSAPAQLIGGILLASLVLSLTMTAYVTAAARPAAAVAPTRASMPPPAAFTPVPAAAEAQIASAAGQARSRLHFGAVETTSWKTLVLVYRQTDVSFRLPDGTPARLRASMPDEMLELVTGIAATTGNRIYNWSDGLADWQLTVALAERPLRQLEPLDNGYWVSPAVIEADLDRHAPAGRYDSVIVVWSPTGGELSVPMPAWGLTLPPGEWSNGAGYSSIATPAEEWWWTAAAAPEELLVHEWLHQVLYFHDLPLDLDAGTAHGYAADESGSWGEWLADVMRGRVDTGAGPKGVLPAIWLSGTPSES